MRKIALIIGAQKSGTTSLFHYLAEHPQVCPCRNKEPFFFADDKRFSQGIPFYFSLWDWQDQHRVAIEASTVYTMQPMYSRVAERIAQVQDVEFSFLYIMRHPLKRIESHISHALSTGFLTTPKVTNDSICFSKYAHQLDPFARRFGKDKLHLLLLEDLKNNPDDELQKICNFLDIDPAFQIADSSRMYNNKRASHFRVPPKLQRMYRSPVLKSTIGRLPSPIRKSLYHFIPSAQAQNFKIPEQEKRGILAQLKPDLVRLHNEYGVDFEEQWQLQ